MATTIISNVQQNYSGITQESVLFLGGGYRVHTFKYVVAPEGQINDVRRNQEIPMWQYWYPHQHKDHCMHNRDLNTGVKEGGGVASATSEVDTCLYTLKLQ